MKKVIFLDIDGVLNRHHDLYGTKEKAPSGCLGVSEKHLVQLKRIVDETGAFIVLISDWKDCFDTDECSAHRAIPDGKYLLSRLDAHEMYLLARTNDVSGRGSGIRNYLSEQKDVANYVILDDTLFDDYTGELLDHLVLLKYPLSKRTADKAIKILNS